ncbi:transposase [Streptomyces sp. PSKA54]|uniref:Transposase n=1 Tax=Streptomyces himalayensis subsp. aureolus TaxID=2758039 RepID=A0A7W2D8X4_9ACTN|nr:transposase [Streptomyces himalayensis subsp. aureolus]
MAVCAKLGDTRRYSSSREVVRTTGLDVIVYASDTQCSPRHLARQGPLLPRWKLFEAAQCDARPSALGYAYYQ